jgi:PAS domain S-box-containing protein
VGGVAGETRQVAGLLRASGEDASRREVALSRMARLAAEACAGEDAAEGARACSRLRDSVLALCETGDLRPEDARLLCRQIDAAQAAALEQASTSLRGLKALDRAVAESSLEEFPRIALEVAPSADSAALLVSNSGTLLLRAAAGLGESDLAQVAAPESVASRAAIQGTPALGSENGRAVLALPLVHRGQLHGVLRAASRSAPRFAREERRFLRALAAYAASLLAAERLRGAGEQEERLRQALLTFESLIDTSPLPIVAVGPSGDVRIWNRAAEELFGWMRDEVLGRPPPYVPPGEEEASRQMIADCQRGQVVRDREVRRLRKDGAVLDLSLSVGSLNDTSGAPAGCISILVNISERKRREADAEERATFRDQFVGIVGHDLRNPLTAIVTSAQLLLRYSGLNDRQARVVRRISSSADRMARMIDDLLDFTRSRLGGGFPIHPRRVSLREVCEHTIEELEFAHPSRGIRFQAEGDPWGSWDPDRMAQVVSNLVGNALQHSPGESPVEVTLRDAGDSVVLETHNGGAPIPPEVLPHIFDPGRRGAGSGGLGLGLFIVQQIVLAHGGDISAGSTAKDGTRITVTLPRRARSRVAPDAALG